MQRYKTKYFHINWPALPSFKHVRAGAMRIYWRISSFYFKKFFCFCSSFRFIHKDFPFQFICNSIYLWLRIRITHKKKTRWIFHFIWINYKFCFIWMRILHCADVLCAFDCLCILYLNTRRNFIEAKKKRFLLSFHHYWKFVI